MKEEEKEERWWPRCWNIADQTTTFEAWISSIRFIWWRGISRDEGLYFDAKFYKCLYTVLYKSINTFIRWNNFRIYKNRKREEFNRRRESPSRNFSTSVKLSKNTNPVLTRFNILPGKAGWNIIEISNRRDNEIPSPVNQPSIVKISRFQLHLPRSKIHSPPPGSGGKSRR